MELTAMSPRQEGDEREEYLRRLWKGDVLIDFDEQVEHFFVLKKGALAAHLRDGKVNRITEPNTYFCALFGFLGDPSFAKIVAEAPSEVYVFPADMCELVEISPEVANTLVEKLLILVKKREKQLQDLQQRSSGGTRTNQT